MNSDGDAPRLQLLLDAETRIAGIDTELASELGYVPDDLLDVGVSRIFAGHELDKLGRLLVALVSGDEDTVTTRAHLTTADGALVDVRLEMEGRFGRRDGFLGFSVLVTFDERSSTYRPALPDHLRRLQVAAAIIDDEGAVIDTNPAWQRFFSTDATPAARITDLIADGDRDAFAAVLADVVAGTATSARCDQRCIVAGEPLWCRFTITAVRAHARSYAVTVEDVSAERLSDRVLQANEQLFRSLTETSPIGLARLAPDLSITYANPGWRAITDPASSGAKPDLASIIHPESRDRTLADVRSRIADGSDEPLRVRLASDTELARWASLRVATVEDVELGMVGHVATIEDVTELVRATESQSRLAGVVESTSDLVAIVDLRARTLLYLNSAAEALFAPAGFRENSPIDVFYAQGEIERFESDAYPVLRRGETWSGEITMVRHDGEKIRVLQTIAAEVGADGEPERASILGRDVTHERRAIDELAYKATHDPLTGLPNRSLLIDHLELALARAARDHTPVAVLFIDLDRFKIINDTHGHDVGDALLQEIADRMSSVLRPSDTVARLGGDEFVILCEDIEGEVDAMTIAGRVRAVLEDSPIVVDGAELSISASVGIAMSNGGASRDADTLLQRADTAMYRAKNSGRARTELYDDELRSRTRRRAQQVAELEQALAADAMELHFQPIVDLDSGRITAVEAFIRWNHPVSGMLYPADFLALAVETSLARSLDAFVLREACRHGHRWADMGSSTVIHLNITGATLLDDSFPAMVERELEYSGLPPSLLCVELGEPFIMGNGDVLRRRLDQMRAIGVTVAIDDVGTGATVLPLLGDYELSMLKIDASLTRHIADSTDARQLFGGVVALGRALGLRIGAEAVEEDRLIPILQSLGAQVAQGHAFAPPLPADRVEQLLDKRSTKVR